MNYEKAFQILGLNVNASAEDVKTSYKKLAKEFHPDRNKSTDATAKMQEINQAKDIALDYIANPDKYSNKFDGYDFGFGGLDLSDIFDHLNNTFNKRQNQWRRQANDINLTHEISFKEAVLGTKAQLSFDRDVPCDSCNAEGDIPISNGCGECNGFGIKIKNMGGVSFQQKCTKCKGSNIKKDKCKTCNGARFISKKMNVNFTISPGTKSQVFSFEGNGHLNIKYGNAVGFTNVNINLIVKQDKDEKGLFIGDDGTVNSTVTISLLDSLMGCTKKVYSIDGWKDVKIQPGTKDGHIFNMPNLGAGRKLPQLTKINVVMPKNVKEVPWQEIWDKYGIER